MRVRPTWATPEPGAGQVLVRQVGGPQGWRRRVEHEIAYHPDGREVPPLWVRRGPLDHAGVPGRTHTTDLHDLARLVAEAWAEGDDGWVAWPVHLPAAVRPRDLRALTPAEAEALATWRERARLPGVDAGPSPVRLAVTRRDQLALDGLRHELSTETATRCGIDRAELTLLDETFTSGATGACPVCARLPAPPPDDDQGEDQEEEPASRPRPVPVWLMSLLSLAALVLTVLFTVSVTEDLALSATTEGALLPGGRTELITQYNTSDRYDCFGQVAYTVAGGYYVAPERVIDTECAEREQAVAVRYDPDDPRVFDTDPRDWGIYFFLACSLLGSVLSVWAWVRYVAGRVRGSGTSETTGEP